MIPRNNIRFKPLRIKSTFITSNAILYVRGIDLWLFLIGCRLCRRILRHFSTPPLNYKGMTCKGAGRSSWTRNKAFSKSCIINTIKREAWPRDRAGRRVSLYIGLLGCWWLWDCEVFVHLAWLFHFIRVFAVVFVQEICWHLTFANKMFVNLQAKINFICAHIWQPQPVVAYFILVHIECDFFLSSEVLTVALYQYILNILFRSSFEKYL